MSCLHLCLKVLHTISNLDVVGVILNLLGFKLAPLISMLLLKVSGRRERTFKIYQHTQLHVYEGCH